MPAGCLSGAQRGIAQKNPAKITLFSAEPTQFDPIGYAKVTVSMV